MSTSDPDADAETAAYHEAGHAVMARWLGGRVLSCSVEDEDDRVHGTTTVDWRRLPAGERQRAVALAALAGPVAEARWRGDMELLESLAAWESDWRLAMSALAQVVAPAERAPLLRQFAREAAAKFEDPEAWELLCRVADALLAHGTLDEGLFADAIDDGDGHDRDDDE